MSGPILANTTTPQQAATPPTQAWYHRPRTAALMAAEESR